MNKIEAANELATLIPELKKMQERVDELKNLLKEGIETSVVIGGIKITRSSRTYSDYKGWCQDNGIVLEEQYIKKTDVFSFYVEKNNG